MLFYLFCAYCSCLSVSLCAFHVFDKTHSKQKTTLICCNELIFAVARNHQVKEAVVPRCSDFDIHCSDHKKAKQN